MQSEDFFTQDCLKKTMNKTPLKTIKTSADNGHFHYYFFLK